GTATPAGSVAFFLCKVDSPALCDTGGTSVGSTNLTGAAYPATVVSPTAYVTSVGRYCWRGEFSGDAANNIAGSEDSSATECFTVNPVTPTLATTAGPDELLGNPVTDTATLSGLATDPADPVINLTGTAGPAAGGDIVFTLFGPADTGCGPLVFTSSEVPVSGNGTYGPVQFTPTVAGEYHWVATYSGSTNNNGTTHNAACTDANEDVVVESITPALSTAQTWVPNDSATITATAGGNLTGTVSFDLFGSSDCTGTVLYDEDVAIPANAGLDETVGTSNDGVAANGGYTASASGNFSWLVSYDSTNPAQNDVPATCVEVSSLTIDNDNTN
ncbi:MAG TPA: hemagglutinin, partial [Intrasporangium sp.]|nr:hemagglutinin [Intrasporangium sp.]